jgi:hypothetical protein
MWVAIHKCMEAILGISLCSYLYLKLAKDGMSFFLSPMLSLQQNWRSGQSRFCLKVREMKASREQWGVVAPTMYAYE